MLKTVKMTAEEKFAAIQKKDLQARSEKETERQKRAEHTATLRALRMTKEANDKKAAENAAAKKKQPSRLPRTNRSRS